MPPPMTFRVIVWGVRFVSATRTNVKRFKDLPPPEVLVFQRRAKDPEDAEKAVEEYLFEEDLIYEGLKGERI